MRRAAWRRSQIRSTHSIRGGDSIVEVMRAVGAVMSECDSKVIGITERDLFIPMLTFVFGQAQLGGGSGWCRWRGCGRSFTGCRRIAACFFRAR